MSDITGTFQRWGEQGKYLAGCEVVDNSIAPTGFIKWVIPSYKYAVIKCNQNTYHEKFGYMINEFMPNNDYILVGAVLNIMILLKQREIYTCTFQLKKPKRV